MNFSLSRAALAASLVLAVPLIGTPAWADDKDADETAHAQSEAAPDAADADAMSREEADEAPAPESRAQAEPEEEKRICRRIRTDMSSRRATRVCLTREEWREYNNQR